MKYIILICLLFVSCNPCKFVSKHTECFPADTVKEYIDVIRVEKEIVLNDSIIYDSTPCDPIKEVFYDTKTIYKTKLKTITDSVLIYKDVSKINPLNEQLKKDYDTLKIKSERHNKLIFLLILSIVIMIALYKIIK